jgi:hypothetical protein
LHPNIPAIFYTNRIYRLFIWKATKDIKQAKKRSPPLKTSQGTWARSNVEEAYYFAEHLAKVFQPVPQKMNPKKKKHLYNFWRPIPT